MSVPFMGRRGLLLFAVVLYMVFTMGILMGAAEGPDAERIEHDDIAVNWSNTSGQNWDNPTLPNQLEEPLESRMPSNDGPPPQWLQVMVGTMTRGATIAANTGIAVGAAIPSWIPDWYISAGTQVTSFAGLGLVFYTELRYVWRLWRYR